MSRDTYSYSYENLLLSLPFFPPTLSSDVPIFCLSLFVVSVCLFVCLYVYQGVQWQLLTWSNFLINTFHVSSIHPPIHSFIHVIVMIAFGPSPITKAVSSTSQCRPSKHFHPYIPASPGIRTTLRQNRSLIKESPCRSTAVDPFRQSNHRSLFKPGSSSRPSR